MFHYSTISPLNVAVNQIHMLLIVSSLAELLFTDIYGLEFIQCPRISLQQPCKSSYTQGLSEINQHIENISQQFEVLQWLQMALTVKLKLYESSPLSHPYLYCYELYTFLPFFWGLSYSIFEPSMCLTFEQFPILNFITFTPIFYAIP